MTVLLVAALVFGAVAFLAARNRLLTRLAVREIARRPVQSLLVVGGLMIGSAAITASLVGADSSRESFLLDAYRSWGNIDVTVSAGSRLLPARVAADLAGDPAVRSRSDGVAQALEIVGSVANLRTRQSEPEVRLVGFDPERQGAFGHYVLTSGQRTLGGDLGRNGVLLSQGLAEQLRARAGDRIVVQAGRAGSGQGGPLVRVAGIARSEGPGAFGLRPAVFAPLPLLQQLAGTKGINVVWISAKGGLLGGLEGGKTLAPVVERSTLEDRAGLRVREVKRASVETAEENTEFLRTMLVAMSLLIVAAGAALVVNLMMMLGEERRPRLGVLRALGLSRRRLVLMSVIEGAIYSLAAAAAGTLVGVGAGRIVAGRFAEAFDQFFGGRSDWQFRFSLRPGTLGVSFAAGALITLVTVTAAARRTSRMSIPAAIRDLPEPAYQRGRPWLRTVFAALAAALGVALLLVPHRFPRLIGGILVILWLSAALKQRLSPRVHSTAIGALVAGWAFFMTRTLTDPVLDVTEFFSVFTLSVLLAVFGLSILASGNLRLVETFAGLLGSGSGTISRNLRAPLAYLARRPVRTGLTTGMFAVVMAILAMFSVFLFTTRPHYARDSAGYDVRVTSTASSSIELPVTVARDIRRSAKLATRGYVGPVESEQFSVQSMFLPLYEVGSRFPPGPPLRIAQKDKRFETDGAVWRALLTHPRYVVSDFLGPGQEMTLTSGKGRVTFQVIASQQPGIAPGIIAARHALAPFAGLPPGETLLVDAEEHVDPSSLARRIESALFSLAVDAQTTRKLLDDSYRANTTFFSVIDILMRMGLVVGVLSLGILGLRAVVERRHVIGVLRALGYRKRGVMAGLMAEAGVAASLGVVVGVVTGLVMGFLFVRQQTGAEAFGVDMASLGTVLALVYAAVAAVTFGPAWRASRLPPAEAVRYSE